MQTLTVSEFKDMREESQGVHVINVLDPDQYEEQHIPDTENVPLSENDFVQQVEQRVGGKDQPVVVYCASESCDASPKAAEKLEKAGFSKVYDFEGGTKAWNEAGLPVRAGA